MTVFALYLIVCTFSYTFFLAGWAVDALLPEATK